MTRQIFVLGGETVGPVSDNKISYLSSQKFNTHTHTLSQMKNLFSSPVLNTFRQSNLQLTSVDTFIQLDAIEGNLTESHTWERLTDCYAYPGYGQIKGRPVYMTTTSNTLIIFMYPDMS